MTLRPLLTLAPCVALVSSCILDLSPLGLDPADTLGVDPADAPLQASDEIDNILDPKTPSRTLVAHIDVTRDAPGDWPAASGGLTITAFLNDWGNGPYELPEDGNDDAWMAARVGSMTTDRGGDEEEKQIRTEDDAIIELPLDAESLAEDTCITILLSASAPVMPANIHVDAELSLRVPGLDLNALPNLEVHLRADDAEDPVCGPTDE